MRFFAEIVRALGAETGESVQYTVVGRRGGYFQNVKKIAEFSGSAVVLRGKKDGVRVEGEHLTLGKYAGGDVAIQGEIFRVERT